MPSWTTAAIRRTWDPHELWRGSGPSGPKAVNVGGQDDSQFMVYAHRSGFYMYTGAAPQLISREKGGMEAGFVGDWDSINWDYGHLIVVRIDHRRREIHIGVPWQASTVVNKWFTLNYFFGFQDPVVFVVRRGVLVPNPEGRKWSTDDRAASDAIYIPQKSRNAVQDAGVNLSDAMLFGGSDGSIKAVVDRQFYDQDYNGNQVGYLSGPQWVSGPNPKRTIYKVAGATLSMKGVGLVNVYAQDGAGNTHAITTPTQPYVLGGWGAETRKELGCADISEDFYFGLGWDNGGVPGSAWEVHAAMLWLVTMWPFTPA